MIIGFRRSVNTDDVFHQRMSLRFHRRMFEVFYYLRELLSQGFITIAAIAAAAACVYNDCWEFGRCNS